jgi:hypothetical protein
MNKIKLKNTPQQVELIQAMADKNIETAMKARQAFAEFVGPVIQQVLDLAPISPMLYTDWSYNEDDDPSLPLDMFYGTSVDHVTVWYQTVAGGLGSSLVTGLQEMKFAPYHIDSAVSLLERNVKRGRLPVVSLALNRMANELMLKQERNAMLVVLRALGEASTNGNKHVIAAATANVLQLDDFNNLLTRSKRINVAFDGAGTPAVPFSRGATDILLSPEMMEEVRGWAYQPMNTRAVPDTAESTAVPLPDAIRSQIYANAGAAEIYGIRLHEALEFGVAQTYNTLFDQFDVSAPAPGGTFAGATDEILLAWDATREVIIRPVGVNVDTGSSVSVQVDDSFTKRSGKLGWYAGLSEARLVADSRALLGLAV